MSHPMNIGDAAGVTAKTIRHDEAPGLRMHGLGTAGARGRDTGGPAR
jgi:hypothetical protein